MQTSSPHTYWGLQNYLVKKRTTLTVALKRRERKWNYNAKTHSRNVTQSHGRCQHLRGIPLSETERGHGRSVRQDRLQNPCNSHSSTYIHSPDQDILCLLWKLRIHCRVHNSSYIVIQICARLQQRTGIAQWVQPVRYGLGSIPDRDKLFTSYYYTSYKLFTTHLASCTTGKGSCLHGR